MKLSLIATEGRLVVEKIQESDKTSGGLYLSAPSNPDIHKGYVRSIGATLKDHTQTFEMDQVVYWSNYSGVSYEEDGVEYLIINQSDIIAVESSEKEVQ